MQSVEELFDKWFEEEIETASKYLITGGARDMVEYSNQVGVVRGLLKSRAKFKELADKAAQLR